MPRQVDYIDIYVEDAGFGHKVYFIGMDNTIVDVKHHKPWFAIYAQDQPPHPNVKKIEGAVPLLFEEHLQMYVPKTGLKVLKVYAPSRSVVPKLAGIMKNKYNASAGLFNVKYEARVSLDFSRTHRLLGVPSPLVFLPNNEMVEWIEKTIEKIKDLKVMAVDIEVYSTTGGFPQKNDPILTITYAVFRLGDNIFGKEWPEENVKTISIPRGIPVAEMRIESRRLVEKFFETLLRERPNIVITYNGTAFDFPYMKAHLTNPKYLLEPLFLGVNADERLLFPHIDLMLVREYLGSSMGLRSQAAYALDDVALEVADLLKMFYDIEWLFDSDYIKAERLLNHAKLKEYWEREDPLFQKYIVADVYLTALIGRVWLFPLLLVSVLTGMPPTLVQSLNTGQIAEYMVVELLTRLGLYPELRSRVLHYSRTHEKIDDPEGWVFNKGKVYVKDYGVFGGPGYKIVELDFSQLYPSDMVANFSDPTMFFIESGSAGNTSVESTISVKNLKIFEKKTTVLLKSGDTKYLLRIVPGYGPVSWFVYKLYTARNETKKLKKRAKKEKRVELLAPDQAIKILNNSFYGAFSKPRGNLVNEVISATVFWRTQKLLYEVIDYINNQLAEKLGHAEVLYGDTDSAYILVPSHVDGEELEKEVNKWIREKYGPFYYMKLEDEYDLMIIPKQKDRSAPSAKSYICLKNGNPAKVKGEFFKLVAPLAIKERLLDFYVEIIRTKPKTVQEVRSIVKRFIEREPIHKWFIKKSVSSLVNEDDNRKLKRLNRDFHYAALFSLYVHRSPGVTVLGRETGLNLTYRKQKTIRIRVDPREAERTQRAIIVHYLPSTNGNPRQFILYRWDDGRNVGVYTVTLLDLKIDVVGEREENAVEKYFEASFSYRETVFTREELLDMVMDTIRKHVIENIYKKLVPPLTKESETLLRFYFRQ